MNELAMFAIHIDIYIYLNLTIIIPLRSREIEV